MCACVPTCVPEGDQRHLLCPSQIVLFLFLGDVAWRDSRADGRVLDGWEGSPLLREDGGPAFYLHFLLWLPIVKWQLESG